MKINPLDSADLEDIGLIMNEAKQEHLMYAEIPYLAHVVWLVIFR